VLSLVVHLAPAMAAEAEARIAALPGAEIVARGEGSRLALTVVDTADELAIDQATAIHRTDGVVAVSLVYHAMDDAADDIAAPEHTEPCEARGGPDRPCSCATPILSSV
jgi:nitrate reductase NapAB chaperone NapD